MCPLGGHFGPRHMIYTNLVEFFLMMLPNIKALGLCVSDKIFHIFSL